MPTEVREMLQAFPVWTTVPIKWGDMDIFGHVNSVSYVRYLETARMDYLYRIGRVLDPTAAHTDKDVQEFFISPDGVGPILRSSRYTGNEDRFAASHALFAQLSVQTTFAVPRHGHYWISDH